MGWRDDRDDERAVERWRARMLERHHYDQTMRRIQRASLWREARTGVLVGGVMIACALLACALLRC